MRENTKYTNRIWVCLGKLLVVFLLSALALSRVVALGDVS